MSKRPKHHTLALSLLCCFFLSAFASAAVAAEGTTTPAEPIFTRYAQTNQNRFVLDTGFSYFNDVLLQEAGSFDGWDVKLDLTFMISKRWQVRLLWPLYTKGEAYVFEKERDFDVEGWSDTFDFPKIDVEYQFKRASSDADFNLAVLGGFGYSVIPLDVSYKDSGALYDRYNHKGNVFSLGLKFDQQYGNNAWTLAANLIGDYYFQSDDLNPSSNDSDDFFFLNFTTALFYNDLHPKILPGFELLYTESFEEYRNLSIVPEVLFPMCRFADLKIAVPLRLAGDGRKYGFNFEMSLKF